VKHQGTKGFFASFFSKREDSSFSEEKEAKRLLFLARSYGGLARCRAWRTLSVAALAAALGVMPRAAPGYAAETPDPFLIVPGKQIGLDDLKTRTVRLLKAPAVYLIVVACAFREHKDPFRDHPDSLVKGQLPGDQQGMRSTMVLRQRVGIISGRRPPVTAPGQGTRVI
jgi:hypothetical protein